MLSLEDAKGQSLRPISRAEYDRLIEIGFFDPDEHLELLGGMLIRMSPHGPEHAHAIARMTVLFAAAFARRAMPWAQLPLALTEDSEPEPDMALVPLGTPSQSKPSKAYLVVEVAQSSLAFDRGAKARLYASAKVPEYWVVNLVEQRIEVHRRPRRGRYTQVESRARGEQVEVEALPGPRFAVEDILPAK
jgi:Uma2 family endonuclease